jgi:quercetin dioxygenase-like cupin family protein
MPEHMVASTRVFTCRAQPYSIYVDPGKRLTAQNMGRHLVMRLLKSRDLVVAATAASVTMALVSAAPRAVLPSTAFPWDGVPVRKTEVGSVRQVVRSPTATLDELEIHITTLNPGQTSHAPHQHPNEELLVVKEGTVEALVNGEWKKLGVGSVIFQASNQLHGIRNVGSGPATYHVINWSSPGMKK